MNEQRKYDTCITKQKGDDLGWEIEKGSRMGFQVQDGISPSELCTKMP